MNIERRDFAHRRLASCNPSAASIWRSKYGNQSGTGCLRVEPPHATSNSP